MNKIISVLKNNLKFIIGGGVALAAIAGISTGQLSKKQVIPELPAVVLETPEVVEVVKTVKPKNKTTATNTPAVVDTRGYAELILAYQGKTLQFGTACQVRVKDQTYKLGSEVLLDNRNAYPVSIKIGQQSYSLDSYGHKVISLNTMGVFMVDCNDYQNVATLTIQK